MQARSLRTGKMVAIMSAGKMAWWAIRNGEEWTLVHARQVVYGDETYGPFDDEGEAETCATEKAKDKKKT